MNSVNSCPSCLRQYKTWPAMAGKEGKCTRCDERFVIVIAPEPTGEGDPILLDTPIEPSYSFFLEGCAGMSRHVRFVLWLAGEPQSPENIMNFVKTTPDSPDRLSDPFWRESYCSRTLERAFHRREDAADTAGWEASCEYILQRAPGLSVQSRDMLIGAFLGVLAEEVYSPPKPGREIERRKRRFAWKPSRWSPGWASILHAAASRTRLRHG